ncbi:high affinity immunoglobulin epsilon receptor subunit beta-like [Trichosurus vulpecula]|uniref:high affinity immunoglobulin epsilon receptor subunit beta-like n=1 Tax=Trichosurus vulpecula TaxID=9337 RepID=UPI00186B19B5|nr:high affinity immunoglobulin epsilon receptor subunit beta-like [Trichosurus vulpecula]
MTSDVHQSTKVSPSDDAIIPGSEEITKSPSSALDKLWSFLKIVLQLLGALQILIGLINTSLWMKWASWLSKQTEERRHFYIFTSGYALWGGLSFTISGIFSFISAKISSKTLVKCCLVTSILSASAALAGIIMIQLDMIVNHECQSVYYGTFTCYTNIVTITLSCILQAFVLVKLTLATMELCISTFLIALSSFQIKVPEEKSTIPFENPYEDLLFQPDPYDEIQPQLEGYDP